MGITEKVIVIFIALLLKMPQTYTKPRTLRSNTGTENIRNTPKNYFPEKDLKQSDKKTITNSDSLHKAFNFHDVEYPVATTPRSQFFFQDYNDQALQRNFNSDKTSLRSYSNSNSDKGKKNPAAPVKTNAEKLKSILASKNGYSKPDILKVASFPEVEYPLSAKETWKPNYWKTDFNSNSLHELLNDRENRSSRIGSKCNPGYNSFPTRSHSDLLKNHQLLKQFKMKAYENNTKENITSKNEYRIVKEDINNFNNYSSDIVEKYTTAIPYYFTPRDCEDYRNSDVSSVQENNDALCPYLSTIFNQSSDANKVSLEPVIDNQNNIKSNITELICHQSDYNDEKRIPETKKGDLFVLDDDYTTDSYLEEPLVSLYSTVSPYGTVDAMWNNSKTIVPDKYYIDDLEDYFISV